ncbi:hypothetical protein NH00_04920 [Enterobacter cancerogenus]|nr:hypothetical protein NH00_04920 [Enterobacter cancerogenus]
MADVCQKQTFKSDAEISEGFCGDVDIVASPHATTKRQGIICRWRNWAASDCFTKGYAIEGRCFICIIDCLLMKKQKIIEKR